MEPPKLPPDEDSRLSELYSFNILDTEEDTEYDRILALLLRTTGMPMGTITLVDRDRQWFKSRRGVANRETSREISFCGHGILSDDLFIVEDARADHRFFDNPLVTVDPGTVFYAGVPLRTETGAHIGMLCVQDTKPRTLTPQQKQTLHDLAGSVMHMLNLRRLQAHNSVLQREVDHRVGNTLQFLSSMLSIYKLEMGDSPRQILAEFENQLHGTAALLYETRQLLDEPTIRVPANLKDAVERLWTDRLVVTTSGPDTIIASHTAADFLALFNELVFLAWQAREGTGIRAVLLNRNNALEIHLGGPVNKDALRTLWNGFRGTVASALLRQSGGSVLKDTGTSDAVLAVRLPVSSGVGSRPVTLGPQRSGR